MSIGQIQIRQQYAQFGINRTDGVQTITQQKPTLTMETTPGKLEISQKEGKLQIDDSRAWDALGFGTMDSLLSRMASYGSQVALAAIGHASQLGKQLTAIHQGGSPIAEAARNWQTALPPLNVTGEPSSGNVVIHYTPSPPVISYQPSHLTIRAQTYLPTFDYKPGQLEFYMKQYGSVEITPPQLDLTL